MRIELRGVVARGLAVYVHWPFCAKMCSYCDFNKCGMLAVLNFQSKIQEIEKNISNTRCKIRLN